MRLRNPLRALALMGGAYLVRRWMQNRHQSRARAEEIEE